MPSLRPYLFVLFTVASSALWSSGAAVDGPLSPEKSLEYLKTEPGLRVELVVSEPMVVSPVAVAWDEKGRMYVVEDRGYPIGPPKGQPPMGQVVLLEDTHGDGKYDKRTVFVEGLTFPNGVLPWDGGVYVTCAPYVYYFKDTDGDGKADVKKIVFKGFQDLSTTQLRVSHPTLAIDNWVYLTSGLTAAQVTSPAHPDQISVPLNRVDGRFRPGTDEIFETTGTAQFGQTFDRFGRRFICSNRNHVQHVVLPVDPARRNPRLAFAQRVEDIPDHEAACRVFPLSANITTAAFHTGFITSACGVTIFEGTGLPDSYRGNSFTCEPAGNLVHRDVLSANNVTFTARRAYATNEFLASPDNWFRPVDLANGPDGCLYVCDMYRKTIEHPEYLPEATRKVTDFESGKNMGRIYRIVSASSKPAKPRKIDLASYSPKRLVEEFENPNIWWRMTAQRLLIEHKPAAAVSTLEGMIQKGKLPEARVHALRTLEAFGKLPDALLLRPLKDKHPAVVEQALAVCDSRAGHSPELAKAIVALASHPDARVRFQCALALHLVTGSEAINALGRIAFANLDDKWTRAAVLSSITERELEFLQIVLHPEKVQIPSLTPSTEGLPMLMSDLGHILGAALPGDKLAPTLQEMIEPRYPADFSWQMSALAGFNTGLRARAQGEARVTLNSLGDTQPRSFRDNLEKLFSRSAELAQNPSQRLSDRLAAIGLLGQASYAVGGATLQSLIDPRQPAEIQTAAVRSLGQIGDPAGGAVLAQADRWNGYTPAVRDAVLTAIMNNTNFLTELFTSIENGGIPAWTVNADRRTQLMRHKDAGLRQRATALFKDLVPGDRMKVYEESKSALALTPDSKNGHAVFQKNCVACHVFAGEGHNVGPDLTGIRNQPAEVILLHIVVPEYEIMPIYTSYNVETKSGQGFSGLLIAETPAAITLRLAQGIDQQVPRSDIASMNTSRLSLMPQELEKAMTKQELSDLIAFLKGQ